MIARFLVLVQIAFRNLFASAINLIIGILILSGTTCMVAGGSMVTSLDQAMSQSVVGSVAGHAQLYSAASKDDLAIYGGMGGDQNLAPVKDFAKVRAALEKVPNVKTIVPMGINAALITPGNTVDTTLAALRDLYRAKQEESPRGEGAPVPTAEGLDERIEAQKQLVRQMVTVLRADAEKAKKLAAAGSQDLEGLEALEKVVGDEFWSTFDQDPYAALEFLENRIAPLVSDADLLFVRYVGTDVEAFQKSFDRMEIVDGSPIPPGQRGFLFSKFIYEEQVKLKAARRLDRIRDALAKRDKKIAGDAVLERYIKENQTQTREITLKLDALKTRTAVQRLQKALGSTETDLSALLTRLFQIDDANFQERYRIFYADIAPLLPLYRVKIGDTLTIKAFTRSGYVKAVNVRVYGTFRFKGLEESPLAGGMNVMDLMSFRDLYGFLTPDQLAELRRMKEQASVKEVSRESAEADLFGGGEAVVAQAEQVSLDESKLLSGKAADEQAADLDQRVYTRAELDDGVVLNAAILLHDPSRLNETVEKLQAVSDEQQLGLKVVGWRKAAGILGDFVFYLKLGIYGLVGFVFIVAMVIITVSVLMAVMQRTQTLGTLRAIGAQRTFVMAMVLVETVVLALVFGVVGAAIGSGLIALVGRVGIAATTDEMVFFFAGPKLFPSLSVGALGLGLSAILVASLVATLFPALMAVRISPVTAMQSEE